MRANWPENLVKVTYQLADILELDFSNENGGW